MPLGMFSSRQFSAANLVTFVVYAALGGVFFLLVAFLQISLGYSPIAAGAASLPVTALMLFFSARSGALAQRIGARIPLTVGPLVIALGLLLMTRIDPGDSYVASVLPAVIVFGLGLTLVVAPVTATVLAAADSRHAGIASGINNAVSRVAGLLAVAVLPVIAGLTGDSFYDPAKMTSGFHMAMFACAGLAAAGGNSRLADDQLRGARGRAAGEDRGTRVLLRDRRHAATTVKRARGAACGGRAGLGQGDRCLGGGDAEAEALLQVEVHCVGVVVLVADREVLAGLEEEVAAAHAEHHGAPQAG